MSAVTTKVEIPNGIYDAIWGGYNLDILNPDKTLLITVRTKVGIKCMNCPHKVKIKNGNVEIL